MNTIQELKDSRDQLTLEVESIRLDLAPFEAALESPEVIQQGRQRAVQDEINELLDQIKHEEGEGEPLMNADGRQSRPVDQDVAENPG